MPALLDQPNVKRIEIPYRPYPLQAEVHHDPSRIRTVCWGRRSGKSIMAIIEGFFLSFDAVKRGVVKPRGVIAAPTNEMLRENWQMANALLKQTTSQSMISEHRLELGLFGSMDFKSTEAQGGAGRGAGYDWAVLDEASRIPHDAWEADLRPALADRQGRALIISTPKGLNWFYDLYQQGLHGDPAIKSWHASTRDCWHSRFANRPEQLAAMEQEWELIRRTTSESRFREEYLAEFLSNEGQLFHYERCLRGQLRDAVPGRHYVAGVDVARKEDWMVTAILEVESQQLVGLIRSRHQDWALQKAACLALLDRYPQCLTHVDSTGVGDPIAQDLRQAGVNVIDVCFTPKVKSELVENLLTALDQAYLGIPDTTETRWLLEELRQYECTRQPSGHLTYRAPEGRHDDGVTALMLAAWGLHGQWAAPELTSVVQPNWWEREGMNWEWLEYERKVRAFKARFPNRLPPLHPTDLAWTLMGRN